VLRHRLFCGLEAALSFTYTETPQAIYILGRVEAVSARCPPGERQRSEPLTKPEPARSYTELFGGLTDCEGVLRLKHAPKVNLADRFI
jgi:hypothetical protein